MSNRQPWEVPDLRGLAKYLLSTFCILAITMTACGKETPESTVREQAAAKTPSAANSNVPLNIWASLDARLLELVGSEATSCRLLMKSLGADDVLDDDDCSGTVVTATRIEGNLDADADAESIVHVTLANKADPDDVEPAASSTHLVLWFDVASKQLRLVGTQRSVVASCIANGSFALKLEPIHTASYSNVVATWTDAPGCNGNFAQTSGVSVFTIMKDRVHTLLHP